MSDKITKIVGRYIYDSRGNPTVEVDLWTSKGKVLIPIVFMLELKYLLKQKKLLPYLFNVIFNIDIIRIIKILSLKIETYSIHRIIDSFYMVRVSNIIIVNGRRSTIYASRKMTL